MTDPFRPEGPGRFTLVGAGVAALVLVTLVFGAGLWCLFKAATLAGLWLK